MRVLFHPFLPAVLLWLGAAAGACAQEPDPARTVPQLSAQLEAYLQQPKYAAAVWGVKIVSLDSGKVLFAHHADRLMSPASNTKLYTGALGLDRLGGDYRIATPVFAAGKISRSGTLRGHLIVAGRGDPSWNERRLGTNFWAAFEPFVAILRQAGVRRVAGDLIADGTYFRGPPTGSGWSIDDLQSGGEMGLLSALTLNDNVAQIEVRPGAMAGARCACAVLEPGVGLMLSNLTSTVAAGVPAHLELFRPPDSQAIYVLGALPADGGARSLAAPVPRPADWFAAGLKLALARQGIAVAGRARGLTWPERGASLAPPADTNGAPIGMIRLGAVLSPPLREVVRDFMKPSQNLEADMLLADVGEATRGSNAPPGQTSEDAGLAALDQLLAAADIAPGDVRFEEGSGLSRNNLTTADATVALLQLMAHHRETRAFVDALPVAGVDGTLRRRFHDTPAAGNVRAKTGTLRWAHDLSGYLTTAAGERLAFSLMLNRFASAPGHTGHEEIDPVVLRLAEFTGRSDALSAETYSSLGRLLVTQFVNAPFPHPARLEGHAYRDEFYDAAEHYSDSTVALFIPKAFQPGAKIDLVVHFHGWRHTVAGTLEEYKLIEQFAASGKNAILIVPQGPRNAPDSFGGKLEDPDGFRKFLAEAMDQLRVAGVWNGAQVEIGNIILSGHSGGYHVMAAILDHGGLSDQIREMWLFDALYGNTGNFVAWQKAQGGRLLDLYTDHGGTKAETLNLLAQYRTNGVSYFSDEDTRAVPDNLRTNRIVFLHTDLTHNEVVAQRGAFGQFLKTSCLQDR